MTLCLRKGVTNYEFFHEYQHFKHCQKLGIKEYNNLGKLREGTLIKETFVFDNLMKYRQFLTRREVKHALDYINIVRYKKYGEYPIDVNFEISNLLSVIKETKIMETTKKLIILFLLIILIVACHEEIQETPQKLDKTSVNECKLEEVRENLYKDCNEDIFLKLKNTFPLHPSQENQRQPYLLHKVVYNYANDTIIRLNRIIDTCTFQRVEGTMNYYMDRNFLYSHPYMILPARRPFYLIDYIQNVAFFDNKDSVKTKFGIFYRGVIER